MSKRDLSRRQKGIVRRYYEHRDTIMANKLTEIVSELSVCDSAKKADRLWKSAATALANTDADPKRAAAAIESRSVEALARLVGEISG